MLLALWPHANNFLNCKKGITPFDVEWCLSCTNIFVIEGKVLIDTVCQILHLQRLVFPLIWCIFPLSFVAIRCAVLTLLRGKGKICITSVIWWPWPKVTEIGAQIFSHTHRSIMYMWCEDISCRGFPRKWKSVGRKAATAAAAETDQKQYPGDLIRSTSIGAELLTLWYEVKQWRCRKMEFCLSCTNPSI